MTRSFEKWASVPQGRTMPFNSAVGHIAHIIAGPV